MPKNYALAALLEVREALRNVLDSSGIDERVLRTQSKGWYEAVQKAEEAEEGWNVQDAPEAQEKALRAIYEAAEGVESAKGAICPRTRAIDKLFIALWGALRRLWNVDRYGKPYELLEPWQYQRIRERGVKADVEYGSVEEIMATGRAECRVCAERIEKGEPSYRFYWDFNGCGSWTCQQVSIHKRDCPSRLEAVKEAK